MRRPPKPSCLQQSVQYPLQNSMFTIVSISKPYTLANQTPKWETVPADRPSLHILKISQMPHQAKEYSSAPSDGRHDLALESH